MEEEREVVHYQLEERGSLWGLSSSGFLFHRLERRVSSAVSKREGEREKGPRRTSEVILQSQFREP